MTETRHAACVALEHRGLLILGPPGAGKSALALELVALGASLVADDQVILSRRGDTLVATAPEALRGLIEARGLGLLRLPAAAETELALAAALSPEPSRLPPRRAFRALGCEIPLLSAPAAARAGALFAALRWGPPLDPDAAVPETP